MKVRIQYSYERGSSNYIEMLLASKSFGEFLNNANYMEQMNEYDQRQLEEYQKNRELVETCKTVSYTHLTHFLCLRCLSELLDGG